MNYVVLTRSAILVNSTQCKYVYEMYARINHDEPVNRGGSKNGSGTQTCIVDVTAPKIPERSHGQANNGGIGVVPLDGHTESASVLQPRP